MTPRTQPPFWYKPFDRWKLAAILVLIALTLLLAQLLTRKAGTVPVFTYPQPGAVFSMDAPPRVTGIADPGYLIQIYDEDRFLGATTADAEGNWSYTLPYALFPGEHHLRARSLADPDRPVATSDPLSFIIAAPVQQQPQIHIRVASYRTRQSFTITGVADPGTTLQIYDGEIWLGQTTSDSAGAWSFNVPGLPAGLHNLTAQVMGPHNKVLSRSNPLDINITD